MRFYFITKLTNTDYTDGLQIHDTYTYIHINHTFLWNISNECFSNFQIRLSASVFIRVPLWFSLRTYQQRNEHVWNYHITHCFSVFLLLFLIKTISPLFSYDQFPRSLWKISKPRLPFNNNISFFFLWKKKSDVLATPFSEFTKSGHVFFCITLDIATGS